MAVQQAGVALTGRPKAATQPGRREADLERQVHEIDRKLTRRVNEMLTSGTLANRPPVGVANRIYVATDQAAGNRVFFDTSTLWITLA